ncbi:putative F-box protein at5g50220 [Phtheirospermum japonicum]|uniref:Putative F-box protein at5g50220 n=1 Tax=Phtheirospermum japonicum TaxID=374723 RepID=A0A830D435_9LAMI|nr:putative F-box protein at5g50220 [Phtheirospermum japonicum]
MASSDELDDVEEMEGDEAFPLEIADKIDSSGQEPHIEFEVTKNDEDVGPSAQIVMVGCWLAMKEAIELDDIVYSIAFNAFDEMRKAITNSTDESGLPSDVMLDLQQLETIGNHFLEVLLKMKHNGAIDKTRPGSRHCATVCFVQTIQEQQRVEIKWIDHLPRDLIIEILSRLHTKDLCKSRRYLSDGIREINNKSKITIELTSIDMQGNITDKFEEIIDGPVNTFVSCGPLSVLCCTYSLYVCNPSTRQVVRVPYRPNAHLHNVAFGYLPMTNEYKIVHMNGKMGCEIFSFKSGESVISGSWRTISDCPFSAWTDEYPVCVDGVIYWGVSSGWKDKFILCLDLEKEEFSSICYPTHENKKYTLLEYVGIMGELCVVGFWSTTMDIWTLKDKKKVWGIECSVNLFPLCPKFLIHCDDHSEEILVHMEQKLICYNVSNRTWWVVEYYKAMKTYNKPCFYYGSLIPL